MAFEGDSTIYDAIFLCEITPFHTFEIVPHITSIVNEDGPFGRLQNKLALVSLFGNVYTIFHFGLLDIGICIILSIIIFCFNKKNDTRFIY